MARPIKIDKEKILSLRAEGKTYRAIGRELRCSAEYAWIVVAKAEGRKVR